MQLVVVVAKIKKNKMYLDLIVNIESHIDKMQ